MMVTVKSSEWVHGDDDDNNRWVVGALSITKSIYSTSKTQYNTDFIDNKAQSDTLLTLEEYFPASTLKGLWV